MVGTMAYGFVLGWWPMLSRQSDFAKTSGKCLFIQHFVETMKAG
jgi:hypothetical protein